MKKVIIGFVSIFLVGILIIVGILITLGNKNNINSELAELKTFYTSFIKDCQKFSIADKGEVKVNADYKGAHGESLPREFSYSFLNLNTELLFESEAGYNILFADKEFLYLLTKEYTVPDDKIKLNHEVRENTYELKFEDANISYQKGEVSFEEEGFLRKKITKVTITLDDTLYTWEKDKLTINEKGNTTIIVKNSNGYSVSYNDTIKMNLVTNKETRADVVMNQYSYSIEKVKEDTKVTMNTPASIYNRLELIFTPKNVEIKKKKEAPKQENPIIRYFDEIKGN